MAPALLSPGLTPDEQLHWLALKLVPGLGPRKSMHLIERLRTPMAIFRQSRTELESFGLPGTIAQTIASGCTFEDAVSQQQLMTAHDATLIPITSKLYPPLLRSIFDPPLVLYVRGRVELLQSLMLGVVGTRRPTPYGITVAERLSADLATAGLAIVSGMARGIDSAAHRAALSVNGKTIAVFGSGVDHVYPAENRKLAGEMAVKGLLMSEFPMGCPGHPQNFPVRNRIVSGMGIGVLVVEGAQYSGSAITARLALDQGREVFAVPGNITNKMSWGPNLLIKQGAKLVQDWNDVVVEFKPEDRARLIGESGNLLNPENELDKPPIPSGPVGEVCRVLMETLQLDVPVQLDGLIESLDACSASEIIAALFELQLLGLIRELPGKNYLKVWGR